MNAARKDKAYLKSIGLYTNDSVYKDGAEDRNKDRDGPGGDTNGGLPPQGTFYLVSHQKMANAIDILMRLGFMEKVTK